MAPTGWAVDDLKVFFPTAWRTTYQLSQLHESPRKLAGTLNEGSGPFAV